MAAPIRIHARLAVTGASISSCLVSEDWTLRDLRLALSAADRGSKCALWLVDDAGQLLPEGAKIGDLGLEDGAVVQVVRSSQRRLLVTTSNDCTGRLYALDREDEDRDSCQVLMGHFGQVYAAVFSPDCRLLVTCSEDSTARIWSLAGEESAGEDHTAAACDSPPLARAILKGHDGEIFSAVFSPDGQLVVTASDDKTARLWRVEDGSCLHVLAGHTQCVSLATFSPVGSSGNVGGVGDSWEVLTASDDASAGVWSSSSGELLAKLEHKAEVSRAEFSPDGRRVVTASHDRTAKVWGYRGSTPDCLCTLRGHDGLVKYATFAPEGEVVVTTSMDHTARLWDATTGDCLHVLCGHSDMVYVALFAPDGRRLVTTSEDGDARVWCATTGEPLLTLSGHDEAVCWAEFSGDGQSVVTASWDCTARLWCASSGVCLELFEGHAAAVVFAAFSDGRK